MQDSDDVIQFARGIIGHKADDIFMDYIFDDDERATLNQYVEKHHPDVWFRYLAWKAAQ